ncbi:hypothetical protein ACWJJH_02630 [Endozoicomonadaceae bacterium StTr2]
MKIFYCCYETEDIVKSSSAIEVDKDTMISIALQILRSEGDFFGITDSNENTLQFIVCENDEIHAEIPSPEMAGSYCKTIDYPELEHMLINLPATISTTTISGLQFVQW